MRSQQFFHPKHPPPTINQHNHPIPSSFERRIPHDQRLPSSFHSKAPTSTNIDFESQPHHKMPSNKIGGFRSPSHSYDFSLNSQKPYQRGHSVTNIRNHHGITKTPNFSPQRSVNEYQMNQNPTMKMGGHNASISSNYPDRKYCVGLFPPCFGSTYEQSGKKKQQQPLSHSHSSHNFSTHIEEERVYCVVCREDYLSSQRDQHALKHRRTNQDQGQIKKLLIDLNEDEGPSSRPIVEPEEYNIQYQPNQFIL